MPRLPTMRVIGSHDISLMSGALAAGLGGAAVWVSGTSIVVAIWGLLRISDVGVVLRFVTGGQPRIRMPPLGFLVQSMLGDIAESLDDGSVGFAHGARDERAGRRIHEGHEFIRESRHGAADADSADVGTYADPPHPSALGHVAVHHRTPAAEFDQAFGLTIFRGEFALLVITAAIAAFVHGLAEEPGGSQLIVEWNHRREARDLIEQIEQRFHHVVGLHGAAGPIHDGPARLRFPITHA